MIGEYGALGLKIVATSASALEHESEMYLKAGCDDFVAKPFRAERIYAALQHFLDVEFEYEEPPAGASAPQSLDLGRIELPEPLVVRLVMAAELHSTTVLKQCLCEVEQTGPAGLRLAEHLRQFMASYDMETIQRIIAQIPVAAPVAQTPTP